MAPGCKIISAFAALLSPNSCILRQSFVSVIGVLQTPEHTELLRDWLSALYEQVSDYFSDFEFVLVNNGQSMPRIERAIGALPEALRKHVFLLNLSAPVNRDYAIIAGLDRANGDYSIIFEFDFTDQAQLVRTLWEKSQEGYDIIYLRGRKRRLPFAQRLLYAAFYRVMRRHSGLVLDPMAHHSRLISRRALNSLLRLRENSRYLKALYSIVGYNTCAIDVDVPLHADESVGLGEQFRSALVAVTSFTTFLRSLLFWIFIFSCGIAGLAIFNAFSVKLYNRDIFGYEYETQSGWAYLVVLISVFFAITCLTLYIMSIYLSNIYSEIKNRPLYIIESVKRF